MERLSFTGNKNLEFCRITVVTKISALFYLQILAYNLAELFCISQAFSFIEQPMY